MDPAGSGAEELLRCVDAQLGRGQPLDAGRVEGQDGRADGVGDHHDPVAPGQRRPVEHPGRVEQLADGANPDHPCLLVERLRRGVQRAAGADGHDGLALRHPPGDAGELARVAEALGVDQHHLGGRVVLPELEQVVAADVRLVAQRDEAGHPHLEPRGQLEDAGAERPGLQRDRHATTGHPSGRQDGPQRAVGRGGDEAHAGRPDDPHAVPPRPRHQLAGHRGLSRLGVGKPAGHHHQATDVLGDGVVQDPLDLIGWHRHDGQRHVVRHGDQARVAGHVGDLLVGRVHRVHRPREPAAQQVPHQRPTDRGRFVRRADDRHRSRTEEASDRQALRPLLAALDGVQVARRGHDVEDDVDDAAVERTAERPSGASEHRQHGAVVGQHLSGEAGDAVEAGDGGQVLQQQRRQPPTLVLVRDHERHLGLVPTRPAVVARVGDDLVAEQGDQGDAIRPCRRW